MKVIDEMAAQIKLLKLENSQLTKQRDDLQAWRYRNERNAAIGRAIQRACAELPDGYDLHIELEKNAGVARLYLADTDASIDEFNGDDLTDYIENAINIAIAEAEKGTQP